MRYINLRLTYLLTYLERPLTLSSRPNHSLTLSQTKRLQRMLNHIFTLLTSTANYQILSRNA